MQVTLNGRDTAVPDQATVAHAARVATGTASPRGVAVALNGEVVPRTEWNGRVLTAGDAVEVLTAFAGG